MVSHFITVMVNDWVFFPVRTRASPDRILFLPAVEKQQHTPSNVCLQHLLPASVSSNLCHKHPVWELEKGRRTRKVKHIAQPQRETFFLFLLTRLVLRGDLLYWVEPLSAQTSSCFTSKRNSPTFRERLSLLNKLEECSQPACILQSTSLRISGPIRSLSGPNLVRRVSWSPQQQKKDESLEL